MRQEEESFDSLEARAKAAREAAERLESQLRRATTPPPPLAARRGHRSISRRMRTEGRVRLAPDYMATCYPGSLYATLLRAPAALGSLANHDRLFAEFKKKQSPQSARRLLDALGVARPEMDLFVRADQQFKLHCADRTRKLRQRAARGDARAKRIIKNRKICDSRGRWVGDLNEALAILRSGDQPNKPGVHKNIQILRTPKLLFAVTRRNGTVVHYLYPEKFYPLFKRACSLAGE